MRSIHEWNKNRQVRFLPEDKEGYITTWSKTLEFHLDANSPFFNWGGENILSVRVYDGGGTGGIFGGVPYVNMIDLVDGVVINNKSSVQFISNTKAKKTISLNNTNDQKVSGLLRYSISDVETENRITDSVVVNLKPKGRFDLTIPIEVTGINTIVYEFIEGSTHKSVELTESIPYILTPLPASAPKINGAKVFGVRPNSPFLFKIPATGKKPLQYSVENLPEGLKVNPATGVITGSLKNKGDLKMTFVVKNSVGTARREFTVKCGDIQALTPPMG